MNPQPADRTGHDHGNPLAYLHAIEVSWMGVDPDVRLCPHCTPKVLGRVPMAGVASALDLEHESTCPDHIDNQP